MSTMNDIVTAALKRLRVINPRSTPDGVAGSDGLSALNRMMHSWRGLGVDTDHETLAAADQFPLDEEHEQGTIALLARRLASDYGMEVPADVAIDADLGWTALQAEFAGSAPEADFSDGLYQVGWRW